MSQDDLIFVDGLDSVIQVLVRWRTGDVLACIGGCQIQAGIRQRGIEFSRLLEIFGGFIKLALLVRLDAFVELRARCALTPY